MACSSLRTVQTVRVTRSRKAAKSVGTQWHDNNTPQKTLQNCKLPIKCQWILKTQLNADESTTLLQLITAQNSDTATYDPCTTKHEAEHEKAFINQTSARMCRSTMKHERACICIYESDKRDDAQKLLPAPQAHTLVRVRVSIMHNYAVYSIQQKFFYEHMCFICTALSIDSYDICQSMSVLVKEAWPVATCSAQLCWPSLKLAQSRQ